MAHLEGAYEQVSQRLAGIESRLGVLDTKVDARLDGLGWRMTALILCTWIPTMIAILLHR